MAIRVKCESCERTLKVPTEYAGRDIQCGCGAYVAIPDAPAATPTPSMPERLYHQQQQQQQ